MIRLILILLFLILAYFCANSRGISNEKRRTSFIKISMLLLILQSGLRNWAVGADTYQYWVHFENASISSWDELIYNFLHFEGKDPFYALFQKTFQIVTIDYQWYLLLVATIFMSALGYFLIKNTTHIRHAVIALILYMGNFYGFFSITGIRQTLATALLLWSYQFIKERKLLYFSILVLIAGLFHISALVFLPLYFLAPLKRPRWIFVISLVGLPLAFIFKNQLAVFFVNFVDVGDRFGDYTDQYKTGGSLILTVAHVLLGIWALSLLTKTLSIAPKTFMMFNTFALALFFFPLQWVNPSAGRIAQYFTVIMMVWIPFLLDAATVNNKKNREFIYTMTIILLVGFTMFTIKQDDYKFFWQDMQLHRNYR